MSVSYSEAGAYVPTFSRFRIPLRRRLPHEPSSRPPCRPSPGAVEAGGHGGGRNKRKGKPQVEKRAAKRGERSESYSCDTILDMLHIFICMECTFFAHSHALLFRSRVFSRALGCGARRGPACTHGASFGPWPCSVARALGVQSHSSWQVITGMHSASPSLAGQWKLHNVLFYLLLLFHVLITTCLTLSSSLLGGSHGTTAIAYQARLLLRRPRTVHPCVCVFVLVFC